jgi:hypothetical protein
MVSSISMAYRLGIAVSLKRNQKSGSGSVWIQIRIRSDPGLFGRIQIRAGSGRLSPDPDLRILKLPYF